METQEQQIMEQASRQLMQYITGKWISRPISVVVELGIADLLAEQPLTAEQLGNQCRVQPDLLYRVLRALSSVEIFKEISKNGQSHFVNTLMSELLREGAMKPIARMFLSDWHNQAWSYLLHSLQSGDIAFETAHQMPAFQWLNQHPDAAKSYHQAQAQKANQSHGIVAEVYDFSQVKTIMDIGGGDGSLMMQILRRHEHVHGTVADQPGVIEMTKEHILSAGLKKRCQSRVCDFFREIPYGSDLYLLSHVLHDWEDEQASVILNNCSRAMNQHSRLLILEMIVPEGNEFSVSKLLDLEVWVMGGGKERTETEFRTLLTNAGLAIEQLIPTPSELYIIECRKNS